MSIPITILYHRDCNDGTAAAWAAWRYFRDDKTCDVRYVDVDYSDATIPESDIGGRHVIMVDFSYKRPELKLISDIALSVLILDHHRGAEKELQGVQQTKASSWEGYKNLPWIKDEPPCKSVAVYLDAPLEERVDVSAIFDMGYSGAYLSWKFFHPSAPVPTLISYVQDRDLWRLELPFWEEIHSASLMVPHRFEDWDKFAKRLETDRMMVVHDGTAVEAYRKQLTADMVNGGNAVMAMTIGGAVFPVVNAPRALRSETAHELSRITGAPYAASYVDVGDQRRFSLRGAKDCPIDLFTIAQMYGGSGHAKAAGFTVPAGWCGEHPDGMIPYTGTTTASLSTPSPDAQF